MYYVFKTTTTLKEYNRDKWYINSDAIPDFEVEAESLEEALEKYVKFAEHNSCIYISKTALKKKTPMYIDTASGAKQVGFVITASSDFQNDYRWVKQFIDLWVSVQGLVKINLFA